MINSQLYLKPPNLQDLKISILILKLSVFSQGVSEVGKVLSLSVMQKGIAILEETAIICSTLMVIKYCIVR